MSVVLLGQIINDTKSAAFLGISDRDVIISYVERALELGIWEENYNPSIGTLVMNSDVCGWLTLPYFVGTVLAVNVAGQPAQFRNAWFEYAASGPGSAPNSGNIYNAGSFYGQAGTNGGGWNGQTWDDREWSPTFEDLREWSALAAICENPADGTGALKLVVEGEANDGLGNAIFKTVEIPLLANTGTTDPQATMWRKITRVVKPLTAGYVRLLGFPFRQGVKAVTLGFYGPRETTPRYRRIRVSQACQCVKVRYRLADIKLLADYDVIPINSRQAMLELIKSLRLSDTNNTEQAAVYEAHARALLREKQTAEEGPGTFMLNVDPSNFVGSLDLR